MVDLKDESWVALTVDLTVDSTELLKAVLLVVPKVVG